MKKLLSEYFLIDGTVFNPEAIFPVLSELSELSILQDGWRFGAGKAPTLESIELARKAFCGGIGYGIFKGAASPLINGGVALDLYALPLHMEIYIDPSGTFSYYAYENDSVLIAEGDNFPWSKITEVVDEFGDRVWRLSESFINGNTDLNYAGSTLEPLKNLAPMAAFQLTNPIAPYVLQEHIAPISQSTMQRWAESQLSFGNSMNQHCRLVTA